MTQVSESLAGRLSVIELTPLLWSELTIATPSGNGLGLFGGYPDGGVLNGKALVNRRLFRLDDAQWRAFQAALDRPPSRNPAWLAS